MNRSRRDWFASSMTVVVAATAALFAGDSPAAPAPAPAVAPAPAAAPVAPKGAAMPGAVAYDRIKSLVGEWIDVDGFFGMKDQVAVSYRLTGGGTTVVETIFIGAPHEMITMYSKDGADLVLTHYCASGNQPRMRATAFDGEVIEFAFDGGTNLDPTKDTHMHSARMEFVSPDEIRGTWSGWEGGKPAADHQVKYHLKRKTS